MIVFECSSCNKKLQVAEEHAGKTIQCPTCKTKTSVPAAPDETAVTEMPSAEPPSPAPATAVAKREHARAAKSDRKRDEDDDLDDEDDRPRKRDDATDAAKAAGAGMGIGMILLIVLGGGGCCVLGVGAILVALLVPAVQKVREAAARTQSTNNLKMIGLGMHSFHDAHKRMPFNGSDLSPPLAPGIKYSKTALANNPTSGSWGFQILPFVDQQGMFMQVNRGVPVQSFLCPGRGRPGVEITNGGGAWTDYFYNNYLNDPNQANRPDVPDARRMLHAIADGTSNTVFAGHGTININQYASTTNVAMSTNIFNGGTTGTLRAGNPAQANPGGIALVRDSPANPGIGSWGGPFPQGGLVLFCDGAVRMIPYSTPGFGAFLTPNGAEVIVLP